LAYLFDIFPTVCELVGVAPPQTLEGRSLAPIIRGDNNTVRDVVFLAYRDGHRAVRRGDWKFIQYPQVNYSQLFHLSEDPWEQDNLANDPSRQLLRNEMLALLRREQERYGDELLLTSTNLGTVEINLSYFPSN
jgi:arylsulfatase A-like enzyme